MLLSASAVSTYTYESPAQPLAGPTVAIRPCL